MKLLGFKQLPEERCNLVLGNIASQPLFTLLVYIGFNSKFWTEVTGRYQRRNVVTCCSSFLEYVGRCNKIM